ncbi:hypothetical protein JW992_09450 [candidate division KSB1 bacterium]|nr:hypothetical protein [candidate division KSB1 bacterium]
MRRSIFSLFVFFMVAGGAQAQGAVDSLRLAIPMEKSHDSWFGKDKGDHLITSTFLTGISYYAARQEYDRSHPAALNCAVGFSLTLGIGKEIYDGTSKTGTASWKDLVADILGTGLGYLLISIGQDR